MAYQPLCQPFTTLEQYHEIAVTFKHPFADYFNDLGAPERIFIYYLYRACLPGNRIFADQLHRDSLELTEIFEHIVSNQAQLKNKTSFNVQHFINQATIYLVYLWSNHCQYFIKEHAHHKRTPQSLNLHLITPENLIQVLALLEHTNPRKIVARLSPSLFEKDFEPTLTVPDNIEQSAINLYSQDFSNNDFEKLSPDDQQAPNSYGYLEEKEGKKIPRIQRYHIGGKYHQELSVAAHWLTKAQEHAAKHPEYFDKHIVKSLEYLNQFLTTGDEDFFKKHSIEWLKTDSRIDYTFGFIETYDDPKSYRGSFEGEVTIKSMDMKKINALLPSLEAQLPFPPAFMRDALFTGKASMPNASINVQAFGSGECGPMKTVAAYCLPNYADIRATHGSKQIIYHSEKGLGMLLNPHLYKKLFYSSQDALWIEKNDPELSLDRDIWMLQVILHETLGHGSGKLATHTFVEGENLTIEGKTYSVGDTIPVTTQNIQQFLAGYEQTLEELRAEAIALYTSVMHYEVFAQAGLLKQWPEKCSQEFMINELIKHMTATALTRLLVQQDDAHEIAGDHARANTTLTNYLIDGGGLEIKEESVDIDGENYTVLSIAITNQKTVIETLRQLTILVQTIRSTGDFLQARSLIETYGKPLRKKEYVKILKRNFHKVVGTLKAVATIYPFYTPVKDATTGVIVDVHATWPKNFIEQQMRHKELMLSTE